jgi:drug/metabolite transporter (DMT)-like permease
MNEMSVEHMVLYRFLFASLGMLPIVIANRSRFHLTRASETRTLLLSAAFGIPIQFLLQFHGLALTTVSHASLMVGAMPVLLAGAAALFAGERLDWIGWLALAGSTCGAALIVLGGSRGPATRGQPSLAGDLLVVASLVTALAWILLSKKLMQTHSPPVVTSYSILAGTAMLAVVVLGPWLLSPAHHLHARRSRSPT